LLDSIIETNNVHRIERPLINPYKGTFLEAFKEQVRNYPNHPAIRFGPSLLTYKELDLKTDLLAQSLIAKGVSKDQLVGLFLPRSLEFIVGMIGILKSGGAFVPMNPTDAKDRLDHILKDSGCKYIVSKKEINLPGIRIGQEIVDVDLDKLQIDIFSPLQIIIPSDSLAYAIYTSGTTGKPKGTLIEHRNLYSLLNNFIPQVDHSDRVLQCMSITCDASIGEIFPALASGATLVLWNGEDFSVLREERITYALLTPSMAELVETEDCVGLKNLMLGGERLEEQTFKKFPANVNIYNGYGPTECTFAATSTLIKYPEKIHIGNRLLNSKLYVVDENFRLCPKGKKGELLIGGDGVGRGYLNLNKLTNEKFIPNPFGEGRVYRTGDLVKWKNETELDYLGRIDRQVKISGFRVELDGIEQTIESFPGVERCHLIPINSHLIAFLTPKNIVVPDLQGYLNKNLPSYARPYKIIPLDAFPRNSAGKIDKKALPIPSGLISEKHNLPEKIFDVELAKIWRKILSPRDNFPIALNDNFFDLGATSLNVLKLIHVLRKRYKNFNINLDIIYKNPTLKEMSKALQDLDVSAPKQDQEVGRGELFLTILKVLPSTLWFVFGYQISLYLFVIFVFFNPILLLFYFTELIVCRPLKITPPNFIFYLKNNLGLDKLNFTKIDIVEETPLEKLKGHIFSLHPHGLTDIHIYPIEKYLFEKGLNYRSTFIKELFYFPFFRTFLSFLGFIPAKEDSYSWAKKEKLNILTTPGDVPEFLTSHHPLTAVLTPNLSFFKVVLKNGMPLVPVLAFNAHKSYKYYPLLFNYRKKLRFRTTLMPIQPFRGRWFLPIPFRTDLKIVFGKPIEIKQNDNPTWEEVEETMVLYKKELLELFKRQAPPDYPEMKII